MPDDEIKPKDILVEDDAARYLYTLTPGQIGTMPESGDGLPLAVKTFTDEEARAADRVLEPDDEMATYIEKCCPWL